MKMDLGCCAKCNHPKSIDDFYWSGGCTEFGTDFWNVTFTCSACGFEFEGGGWGTLDTEVERLEAAKEAGSSMDISV